MTLVARLAGDALDSVPANDSAVTTVVVSGASAANYYFVTRPQQIAQMQAQMQAMQSLMESLPQDQRQALQSLLVRRRGLHLEHELRVGLVGIVLPLALRLDHHPHVLALLEGADFHAGRYELRFHAGDYLRAAGAQLADRRLLSRNFNGTCE